MEPVVEPHLEFEPEKIKGLKKRATELKAIKDTWRWRQEVFSNLDNLKLRPELTGVIDPKNPMEFKAYEKAAMTVLAEKMLTTYKFTPGLFAYGITPFKQSITSILLNSGIKGQLGLVAAVGLVTAVGFKGEGVTDKAKQLGGFFADAVTQMGNIANVPSVNTTLEEVGTAKYYQLKQEASEKIDEIFAQMGNYLTQDQKSQLKEWLVWSDGEKLNAAADTMKTFDKEAMVAQSMVFWNCLNTFLPFLNTTSQMQPAFKALQSQSEKQMNDLIAAAIEKWKEAGGQKMASIKEHNTWIQDAAAAVLVTISYGVKPELGVHGLPGLMQMAAIIVPTEVARQSQKLYQASIEKKYGYPW